MYKSFLMSSTKCIIYSRSHVLNSCRLLQGNMDERNLYLFINLIQLTCLGVRIISCIYFSILAKRFFQDNTHKTPLNECVFFQGY